MIRTFISLFLPFSFLIASSITAKNAGERLNVDQSAVAKVEQLNSATKNQLTKAERQQKTDDVRAKSGILKKEMDTKINIAKKMFSAKNQKKVTHKSIQKSTSNFDPNSINLKMKRSQILQGESHARTLERNIANNGSDSRYKIHPKISKGAIDPSVLERQQEEQPSSPKDNIPEEFLPENVRERLSEIELRSLYNDIVGNQNPAAGSNRDEVWVNTQEIEYLIYDQINTPTYFINNYFDNNHNSVEGVWYNYQGDADNGEWLLSQLRLSSFDENGNEVQRTWHNYDANSDNWVPSVQYNISYNDNNDREVYDVSFWDINSQTWTWSYHYTYQYSETLNEIYGYLVEGGTPSAAFWYAGTTINENELATHTIYQQFSGYYGGYWYNYAQEFYTYDANGNMITNLGQDMVFATGEWRDANLWTMEYVDDTLYTETYQFNDWDYSNGALINSAQYHYSYDEYGNMMEYFTYFFDASLQDWYEYYVVVYIWEEATHDGGEVTGVEYYFESVGDMFSVFGDILESGGDGCVDCEGNLDNMSGYLLGHIDEALGGELTYDISEESLLAWEQNYGSFYFQFRDDNGNMMFDTGETYAVSLENGPNGEMHVVSFEGFLYDLDFQMFWMEAYDFEFYPDGGGEEVLFDYIGDSLGTYYFVSQQPMSWHDGLNWTDTVDVGGDIVHMATITSENEKNSVFSALISYGIGSGVWLGLTDEYEEGVWQWVTGEPVDYTNWAPDQPDNLDGIEHYTEMWPWQVGAWNDVPHDAPNHVLIEYIPNNNEEIDIAGEWQMAPMPGALRVGPEPFNGDWWANSAEDVQTRACYFDDRYVFDEDGFHNDQGDETWIEFWQGGDYNGDGNLDWQDDHCGAPMYPHDGSSNPAEYIFDEATGTLTLNGMGAYIGLPKADNGYELESPDQADGSVTYQVYMQESPRMMTLVIEVWQGVFWTFDLVPALDGESVYFAKEDYADVMDPNNWDHVTGSVAIMRGDNQGLYNPYFEESYNGWGPSGTLWSLGSTSESDPMGYMEWVDAIGGQAANLPGQTLSMWCLEENLYFDVQFESWTSGNNGGGFSYWRTLVAPPVGPDMYVVWGMMGSDEAGDGSFENPFATIGHAVDVMNNNDWVIVGPGNYNENISVTDKSGMIIGVTGPDSTFIDGNGAQIMASSNGFWMMDGFTFTNGNAVDGGALLNINGGLFLGRSMLVGNNAENNGGAVAAINSTVYMDSVMFSGNNAANDGGALFVHNFTDNPDPNMAGEFLVALSNSAFVGNTSGSQGAGLYIEHFENGFTYADLFNVDVKNNSGYSYVGLRFNGNVQGGIYGSHFVGNQAQAYAAAGGFSNGSYADLQYCLIAHNQANLGGGTANAGGFSVWSGSWGNFYQCTFVGNSAEYGSALTVGGGSGAMVDGSIVWNNPGENALAAVQWDDQGSSMDVYNSVVQGGESGMYADDLSYIYHDGVLDMDPFFCDPANGDFSIDVNSQAITPWGEPMGALGYGCEGSIMASAVILGVDDVPNDQGGRVYVTFEKSLFDTDGLDRTEMYTVERMDGDQWVGLTSVGAYASDVYVVEVTTLADSTSEGDAMMTYRVVANMDEGNFESDPASGFSVDNIAPMMVTGLNAEVNDGMVMLSWSHSDANDFSHYAIYYSTQADFVPSEETMIGTHSMPSFEHNVEEIGDHYYVVSAVDLHENESEYSEAVNVTLLSLVDVHGLPETFALHQNYPNPFNPSTTIRYDLPEASSVSLIIYDMMGREVITLMSGYADAGYHFVQWDGKNSIGSSVAAGVYIYTIQAGTHRDINKMIFLK